MLDLSDKQLWPELIMSPADSATDEWLYQGILPSRKRDEPPKATDRSSNFKRILLTKGIPLWGERIFSLRDVAGEHFENFTFTDDVKAFCIQSKCAIFMIDVNEILSNPSEQFHTLFERYIRTIVESGETPRNRKVIAVLSKADMFRERLPDNLHKYLLSDPLYQDPSDKSSPYYIDLKDQASIHNHARVTLPLIDQQLSNWVASLGNGGRQLINQAKDGGVELRFTLASGWGNKPGIGADVHPLRILDPLIWLLEFHSRDA